MKQHRPAGIRADHGEDSLEGRVVQGAGRHRNVEVLKTQVFGGLDLVERPGLDRIPDVEDDLHAGRLERLEVRRGRLAAGQQVGEWLRCVGNPREGIEWIRHS